MTIGDKSSWGVPDFNEIADQVTSIGTRVTTLETGGSPPITYFITDDGTTSTAYKASGGFLAIDTDADSSALAQRTANRMDPLNGGTGGGLFFCKPSAGSGYRWNAPVRLPLELTGSQHFAVATETGTLFLPQTTAAFPLFTNHRTAMSVAQAGFSDDATIYVTALAGTANGKALAASGSVSVGGHLVTYTGIVDSGVPGATRYSLTGCAYAGNAALTVGASNAALTYTAVAAGTGGTAITIAYVVAGANTPLSIGVVGNAITVNVATDGGSSPTSTALQVMAAIRASAAAAALVNVMLNASSGASVVAAAGSTALSTHFATTISNSVVVPYENWQHTTLDFTGSSLNCTNLSGAGSSTSLFCGQLVAGSHSLHGNRLNILDAHVRGGQLTNAPNDRIHYPVFLSTLHRGPGEPTQTTIRDLSIRGLRAGSEASPAGASTAVAVAGKSLLDPWTCINALIDEYDFRDNHLYSTYSAGYVGISSVQIGGVAKTGTGWVEQNKFLGGSDLGVEIDNVQKASFVRSNEFEDMTTDSVLFYNFTGGSSPGGAHYECSGTHTKQTHTVARYLRMYQLTQNQEESYNGTLIDRDNTLDWTAVTTSVSSGSATGAYLGASGSLIKGTLAVVTEGNTIDVGSGVTLSSSAGFQGWGYGMQAGSNVSVSGGAQNLVRGSFIYAGGASGNAIALITQGPVEFRSPLFVADLTVSGSPPASALRIAKLGAASGSTLRGRLRVLIRAATGGTNPMAFDVGSQANLTFPAPFIVEYDGSGLGTTTAVLEVNYNSTSNKGFIRFTPDSIFKMALTQSNVSPGPGAANGTGDIDNVGHPNTVTNATGTWYVGEGVANANISAATTITAISGSAGALTLTLSAPSTGAAAGAALTKSSPFMYQNNDGFHQDFISTAGTGVVVKITPDISATGAVAPTLYTTVLSAGVFRLVPRSGIQITYTTVPTVNRVPVFERGDA